LVVEINRTTKTLIERYKSTHNRYKLDIINNTIHAVNGTTPQDALNNTNEFRERRNAVILKRMSIANLSRFYQEKLNVGDTGRLKIKRSIFEMEDQAKYKNFT